MNPIGSKTNTRAIRMTSTKHIPAAVSKKVFIQSELKKLKEKNTVLRYIEERKIKKTQKI